MDKRYYFECECEADEHRIVFNVFEDGKDSVIYVHHFLGEFPFYKRVWLGIKYIFGYKSSYGHFQESLLGEKSVRELRGVLDDVIVKYYENTEV